MWPDCIDMLFLDALMYLLKHVRRMSKDSQNLQHAGAEMKEGDQTIVKEARAIDLAGRSKQAASDIKKSASEDLDWSKEKAQSACDSKESVKRAVANYLS